MRIKQIFIPVVAIMAILVTTGCGKNPTKPGSEEKGILFSKDAITFQSGHLQDAVILTNRGGQVLSWDVTEKPEWVAVNKLNGTLRGSNTTDTLRVLVSTSGLAAGTYQGSIHVEWDGGETDISVLLTHQAARLDVNLPILNFDRNVWNGNFVIINRGTEFFEWTITEKPAWIEVNKDSGMVFDVPDTVLIRINYAGMAYGEYTDSLHVVSTAGNMTITINFIMERLREVIPGYEVGKIRVGAASYQKILDTYGHHDQQYYDDNLFEHSVGYSWLGLRFDFYSEQLVLYPNTPCTEIIMASPYDGLTEEDLGIGSTRAEVVAAYGEPGTIENGEEVYDTGVSFLYESGLVKTMRIFEP